MKLMIKTHYNSVYVLQMCRYIHNYCTYIYTVYIEIYIYIYMLYIYRYAHYRNVSFHRHIYIWYIYVCVCVYVSHSGHMLKSVCKGANPSLLFWGAHWGWEAVAGDINRAPFMHKWSLDRAGSDSGHWWPGAVETSSSLLTMVGGRGRVEQGTLWSKNQTSVLVKFTSCLTFDKSRKLLICRFQFAVYDSSQNDPLVLNK